MNNFYKVLLVEFILFLFSLSLIGTIFYKKKVNIFNLIKYILSIGFTGYVSFFYKDVSYLAIGIVELFFIYTLSNLIACKFKKIGYVINSLLIFLYNANLAVLLFGGEYLSVIMVTNLDSISDLVGKALIYILATLAVIGISFLPLQKNELGFIKNGVLFLIIFILEIVCIAYKEVDYSPLYNYKVLITEGIEYKRNLDNLKNRNANKEDFYREEIGNYVKKNKKLSKQPNVILIFTEGLSQHIIDDTRNIMPNVKEYQNKSMNFTNYYDHTFATFRGLIGQLYSGFQFDNRDTNSLISLADIFNDEGYNTTFINTEPKNKMFTNYLESFGFNEVISDDSTLDGVNNSISDKLAYERLFDKALELNKEDKPFFLSMYTFGTHISFDSVNEKYHYGDNNLLNRFYDLDYQYGEFMKKYEESDLFKDTIIIFTTDHASYMDNDYLATFNGRAFRSHAGFGTIPLFFYYKGVKKEEISANYKTSLDLAPTILDILDIEHDNYFLGNSLFKEEDDNFLEHIFYNGVNFAEIVNKKIVAPRDDDKVYTEKIYDYLSIARVD